VLAQEPATEVVLVPARLNQHDGAAGLQASESDRLIPVVKIAPIGRTVGVLVVLYGIVDEEEVGAAPSERSTAADRVI